MDYDSGLTNKIWGRILVTTQWQANVFLCFIHNSHVEQEAFAHVGK